MSSAPVRDSEVAGPSSGVRAKASPSLALVSRRRKHDDDTDADEDYENETAESGSDFDLDLDEAEGEGGEQENAAEGEGVTIPQHGDDDEGTLVPAATVSAARHSENKKAFLKMLENNVNKLMWERTGLGNAAKNFENAETKLLEEIAFYERMLEYVDNISPDNMTPAEWKIFFKEHFVGSSDSDSAKQQNEYQFGATAYYPYGNLSQDDEGDDSDELHLAAPMAVALREEKAPISIDLDLDLSLCIGDGDEARLGDDSGVGVDIGLGLD